MWVTLRCESSAKCKTENRCEKVSPGSDSGGGWFRFWGEENFRRQLYDPASCGSMACIHSSSSSLSSGGNLQRQLMGGAVGPMIFNCWWWVGVSWNSLVEEFQMNHPDCLSLKFSLPVLLQKQPLWALPGGYCARSMLQKAEGSAFTKTSVVRSDSN